MKKLRHNRKLLSLKIKLLLIFSFVIFIALFLDNHIRPLVKAVLFNQAQTVSINVINQVVMEELSRLDINYSDIVDIQKDSDGKILAVTTDMKKINSLKSLMTVSIQEKINNMGSQKINVPIGSFTGTDLLNGRGPKISIEVNMSSSVVIEFKSEFVSAGINQTKHKLYLDISTQVFALIPGYPVETVADTNVLIAETIIVGDVPALFAGK